MQDDRVAAAMQRALAPARSRSLTAQLADIAERISPLRLGMAQALVAFILSSLMLSIPATQPGFQGIFNNVNGPRAYERQEVWLENIGWIGRQMGGIGLSPESFVWLLRAAHMSLWAMQAIAVTALAVRYVRRGGIGPIWRWAAGPVLSAFFLLAYPPLCADVFYYTSSGWVASVGSNPYAEPLRSNFDAPLLSLNDWGHIASPYGPFWTDICQMMVRLVGTDLVTAVLSFRLLAVASAVVFVGIVFALARQLTGDRTLAICAAIAVSWMPSLIFETSTGAHNDALMFDLALGGLLVMTTRRRGSTRIGLLLIALSALLKYVTLPLIALAMLWRLGDRKPGEPLRPVVKAWAIDAAAMLALATATYGPYWDGPRIFLSFLAQPSRGVSASIWILPQQLATLMLGPHLGGYFDDVVGYLTLIGLLPVFWFTIRWLWRQMNERTDWSSTETTRDRRLLVQLQAWVILTCYLAFIPCDTHDWYAIWSIAPVFILLAWLAKGELVSRRGGKIEAIPLWIAEFGAGKLCAIFLAWSCFNMVLYHTRTF